MRSSLQVNIRKATADDLPKIVEHMEPTGDAPFYPFAKLDKLQNISLDGLFTVEVEGEYAGFLYWFVGENPEFDSFVRKYGYIEEFQVLEKYRGQGIGRRLLTYALSQMKEAGVEAVYLRTREGNTPAQNLYESMDFSPYSRHIRYKLVIS